VLGLLGSLFFEPLSWPQAWTGSLVSALLVTAIFATVYTFWVMTSFQRLTTPTRAALIYTLEPVFAAIFSVWLHGDRLTALGWVGGGLIVFGMVTAEIWPKPANVDHSDCQGVPRG
jgi:drug/metabolite transporter (DMT)-like permease